MLTAVTVCFRREGAADSGRDDHRRPFVRDVYRPRTAARFRSAADPCVLANAPERRLPAQGPRYRLVLSP